MITRTILTVVSLAGLAAAVMPFAACSSDEEAEKFGSSDSFCSAKAEAECKNLAQACGATPDACKQKRTAVCNGEAAAAANQGRSYRANAAQACIDKIGEVYKNNGSAVTRTLEEDVTKVCARVFGGSKQANAACANSFECEGALVCDRSICVKEENAQIDGQCNNAGQVCVTGSYCQQRGANKFCVAKNQLDQTCGADNPCIETLRCVNRCVEKVKVGDPCDTDDECADAAPLCDLTTTPRKCRPKYQAGTSVCKDFGSAI